MPAEDRVGRDQRGNLGKGAPADSLAPDGKTATLVIGQPESPATELLPEDSILLTQILNYRILLAGDPSGQGRNEDLPRLNDGGHPSIAARGRSN